MKKHLLYFYAIVFSMISLVGCSDSDVVETVMYAGSISYAQDKQAPADPVYQIVLNFFQNKLNGMAVFTASKGSFFVTCTNDKQATVTQIIQSSEEELKEMIKDNISSDFSYCNVIVTLGQEIVLNVEYKRLSFGSDGGHDVTEGTVPGFTWQ